MRKVFPVLLAASLVFVVASRSARADVLFDTLNLPTTLYDEFSSAPGPLCEGFIVGPSDYSLQNVVLSLTGYDEESYDGIFTVGIYDNTGVDANALGYGAPGNLLFTLDGDTDPQATNNYTYTASSPFTLHANTTYFVVVATTDTTATYGWAWTSASAPAAGNGGFFGSYNDVWQINSVEQGPDQMQVNADPLGSTVPEPSTLALLLTALPLGLLRRKRRA